MSEFSIETTLGVGKTSTILAGLKESGTRGV